MTTQPAKKDPTAIAADEYLDFDLDAAEEDARQQAETAEAESKIFFSHPGGERALRIIPPHKSWLQWFTERGKKPSPFFVLWKHFYEDPNNPGNYISAPCPRKMNAGACQICDQVRRLKVSDDPVDQELADDMDARHVAICNVIDRDDPQAGILVWEMSYPYRKWKGKSMYEKVRAVMQGRARRNLVSPGPNGYDLIITKSGTGRRGTSYTLTADAEPRPLHDDPAEALALINEQHDLRTWVIPPTPEQLAQILSGERIDWNAVRQEQSATVTQGARPALPQGQPVDQGEARPPRDAEPRAEDFVDVGGPAEEDDDDLDF